MTDQHPGPNQNGGGVPPQAPDATASMGAVPPGGGHPPAPPAPEPKKKRGLLIAGVVALVLLLLGVGVLLLTQGGDDEEASGEIFLEPAASVGEDPFAEDPLADPPDPALAQEAAGGTPDAPEGAQLGSQNGSEPGLYGGTMNQSSCDPAQLVSFLQENPDKAAAWVAALNADPELRWEGGPLTVDAIPAYVAELTPITLIADTRVTNHGFAQGVATARQSVIQKGSAVLVDKYGVPRVKCYCGNPLLPPEAASGTPAFVGPAWPDFSYPQVTVVKQVPNTIEVFVLKDPSTGQLFERPAGSTGDRDRPADPGATTTTSTTTTTAPGSTTAPPTTAAPTTAPPTTEAPTTVPPPSVPDRPCPFTDPFDQVTFDIVNSRSDSVAIDVYDEQCNRQDSRTLAPGERLDGYTYIRGGKLSAFTTTGQTISSFQAAPGATWTIS